MSPEAIEFAVIVTGAVLIVGVVAEAFDIVWRYLHRRDRRR
jgi:hypothetical protein